jgi:hypothetical protein
MPLPTNLTTNEVKDAAGAEVQYYRRGSPTGFELEFIKDGELPSLRDRLVIGHKESGVGLKLRRRSRFGFALTSISSVDLITPVVTLGYTVLDSPIGALAANTVPAAVMARLGSFGWSLGASTTILYDGTGSGVACLMSGGF